MFLAILLPALLLAIIVAPPALAQAAPEPVAQGEVKLRVVKDGASVPLRSGITIVYSGAEKAAYCAQISTDGTPENAAAALVIGPAIRALWPWDEGSFELVCNATTRSSPRALPVIP